MHDENQQSQAQPDRPDAPSQQTLELVKRIITRKTVHTRPPGTITLELLSSYLKKPLWMLLAGYPPARVRGHRR